MNLKTAFLAAASLVVLVNATSIVHGSASLTIENVREVDVANTAGNTAQTGEFLDNSERAVDPCKVNCHAPWVKCVRDCGGGASCEQMCNCILFSDPKQLCRTRKCVQPPANCHARKARDVDFTTSDDSEITENLQPLTAGVPIPCVVCATAIKSCNNKCTTPGGCGCECFHKKNNPNCRECSIPCSSLQQRSAEDIDNIDVHRSGSSEIDVETTPEDPATAAPPLHNPCLTCQYSINSCKKKCAAPGLCDDWCNCYHKRTNRNCKECNIKCDCGYACPRLALRQREVHELEDLTEQDIQDLLADSDESIDTFVPPGPIDSWSRCASALGECRKTCEEKMWAKNCVRFCQCRLSTGSSSCRGLGLCKLGERASDNESVAENTNLHAPVSAI
ncbi:hypothetical protein FB567DRAFT_251676 [Paraphoma chrysanthemicola]|uniref:Uncharacterized protein n=1 Tax=Paraphoma chrysanthemicola TaxID=798071 RepID=A0A8K0QTW2_9PLEO|nr:hypothetical protein FB567DRAFT_251676 [Paraphoma chrysanthemicola]